MTRRKYPARCEFDTVEQYRRACERVDMENMDYLILILSVDKPQTHPGAKLAKIFLVCFAAFMAITAIYTYAHHH